ncbi:MAG: amino acid adenylation domain-containing protein [Pseudomonadota bacterium]
MSLPGDFIASNLTVSQFLIWLGQQQFPTSPMYNSGMAFSIRKDIDPKRFAESFAATVSQSDALRSVFTEDEGIPQRRVLQTIDVGLPIYDLSGESDPYQSSRQFLNDRVRSPLDLSARAFDACLVQLGTDHFVWYLNVHHIIADAWGSMLIYIRVAAHYTGRAASTTETPLFEDQANAERDKLIAGRLDDERAHWNGWAKRVGSAPLTLMGRPVAGRPGAPKSVRRSIALGTARSERLAALFQDKNFRALSGDLTIFQACLTALFVCLYRLANEDELVVAATASNRPTPKQKDTVGLFMEVYGLAVEIDEQDGLLDVFKKVAQESLSFLTHAQAGASGAAVAGAGSILFNYLNVAFEPFDGAATETEFLHAGGGEAHHVLRLQIRDFDRARGLWADFDFREDFWSFHEQEVFTNAYLAALDALLDDPAQKAKYTDIRSRAETTADVVQGAAVGAPPAETGRMEEAVHAAGRTCPDRIAIADGDERITYAALANEVAKRADALDSSGAGRGDVVAIQDRAGISSISWMLAAMRAGCVYLPIDPEWPSARSTQIIDASRARFMVGSGDAIERRDGVKIDLDTDESAYVLFTSGSTGAPKGVVCRHSSVLNLLNDIEARAPLQDENGPCALWTNIGFDVSVYEIFSALNYGRTLHIAPEHLRADSEGYFDWLWANNIVSAYTPPFMLGYFAERSNADAPSLALQRMLVGVEPIPEAILRSILKGAPDLSIVNGYGPTETTICATFYDVPHTEDNSEVGAASRTPIGKPLRGNVCRILDRHGMAVPHGVSGELYIGGAGVAAGYLHDPKLTAERFCVDPLGEFSEMKFYRTGDRMRMLSDGNMVFEGRVDSQLKVQGYRIEPAEIAAALSDAAALSECHVMGVEIDGNSAIAAYVVMNGEGNLNMAEWREALRARLPRYMIPDRIMTLDRLPRTLTGKLDTEKLRRVEDTAEPETQTVVPMTVEEEELASLWREVLGVGAIGPEDHFIDLGGDSIKALKLCARIGERGQKISPRQLFRTPTIRALAAMLGEKRA